ncbi:MAG TPA: type IV secretion system protein VirB10 [Steroidobacteraceae bacterium]|nr:type IV secretion system protein VirB10 [Steroidobacteraceae bacterium]
MKPDHDTTGPGTRAIAGDRGQALVYRERSLQSRINSVMALVITLGLGGCLLAWYYGSMLSRPARAAARGRAAQATTADAALPPLGPDPAPIPVRPAAPPAAAPELPGQGESDTSVPDTAGGVANPAAGLPMGLASAPLVQAGYGTQGMYPVPGGTMNPAAHHVTRLERQLSGPAFARQSGEAPGTSAAYGTPPGDSAAATAQGFISGLEPQPKGEGAAGAGPDGALAGLLTPTVVPAARPGWLPSQRYLLPKGAFIDCTLETAIDSSLPGMTTCITATDTFSADGKVVLLERGSKLVGETRGQVQQGSARLFVLWTEARTPAGVVVPLASPGTDELGRSGLPGEVDRHFWQRFGAAILVSVIDGAAQSAAQRSGNGGTVVLDPASSQEVATEALKGTINIPPTLLKNQGDRIQVLVARDLDFRSVYDLREAPAD